MSSCEKKEKKNKGDTHKEKRHRKQTHLFFSLLHTELLLLEAGLLGGEVERLLLDPLHVLPEVAVDTLPLLVDAVELLVEVRLELL